MNRPKSPIKPHEVVVFFPTSAHQELDSEDWNVNVHGWIFQPEENSLKRPLLLGLLRRVLKLSREQTETGLLKQRLRPFLVDNERGRKISIELGGGVYQLPKSKPNGHFQSTFSVPNAAVGPLPEASPWLPFRAITPAGDERVFSGRMLFVPQRGVSVISDIDDTIKVTNVGDHRELLANTFLREFRSVPSMAAVYRRWAEAGACFHYVSSSPWQLFQPLCDLFDRHSFPAGSVHLREFRVRELKTLENLAGSEEGKSKQILRILSAYPQRTFVFVGDSGEKDAEMYGDLARRFPHRVARIYIRNVTEESPDSDRFTKAFAEVPRKRWMLFDEASELLPPKHKDAMDEFLEFGNPH